MSNNVITIVNVTAILIITEYFVLCSYKLLQLQSQLQLKFSSFSQDDWDLVHTVMGKAGQTSGYGFI